MTEFERRVWEFKPATSARIEFGIDGQGIAIVANAAGFKTLADFLVLAADSEMDWKGGDHFHLADIVDDDMIRENRVILKYPALTPDADFAATVSLFRDDDDADWPSQDTLGDDDTPGTWTEKEKDLLPFRINWSGMTKEDVVRRFGEPLRIRTLMKHLENEGYEYETAKGRTVVIEFSVDGKIVGVAIP